MLAAEILANVESRGPRALDQMRAARHKQQDAVAGRRGEWIESNRYFYERIRRLLRFLIEPGKRVLQVRCQTGHLLNAVEPSYGVGAELGEVMVDCARRQFPQLHFVQSDPEDLELGETFDYVLFDHIFDTVDILKALEQIRHHCTANTRIVVINYNHLWQPVLEMASEIAWNRTG